MTTTTCNHRGPGWPSLLCSRPIGHDGNHRSVYGTNVKEWPDDTVGAIYGPHRSGDLARSRAERTREACRWIGGLMHSYVTGDPGDDGIVEYLAEGWLRLADYYDADDTTTRTTLELVRSLRLLSTAAARLADDLDRGEMAPDELRRLP